jgi:hypothetical protein
VLDGVLLVLHHHHDCHLYYHHLPKLLDKEKAVAPIAV